MSLFLNSDYRTFIQEHLSRLPKKGRGELVKIAEALNVHPTLISLVLSGERDFSPEQGYDLANYLELTDLERDYFYLLIQISRAGNPRLQDFLTSKLEKIKKESAQLSKRIDQQKVLTDEQRAVIYSSWIYSAVRLFTSTDEDGKTLEQIQTRFRLPRSKAVHILNFLESAGLVQLENDKYRPGLQRTFLEHGSPHLLKHHTNWRIKALQQADQISLEELMFTSPVSLSKTDFAKLREEMADFIKNFLEKVAASPAEEMACLNMDFFFIKD